MKTLRTLSSSIFVLGLLIPQPAAAADEVSLESLLGDMVDRGRVAEIPSPHYLCRQFSSYDRDTVGDGEEFPSHIGPGTEDYYGHAWCRPEYFQSPFHAQLCGDGNLSGGYSVNSRYRILDTLPFTTSIRFDMELWHWGSTKMNYAPAVFWYARPGATCNVEPDPEAARLPVAKKRSDVVEIRVVPGAIEGESLTTGTDDEPTNFVFFLVDDLGWTDLGCFGSSFYDTPNVDRLAASGQRFTDGYAACPVCSPTRASIMAGKYPARMSTTDFFGAGQPDEWRRNTKQLPATYEEQLAHEEVTIAEALKEAGYATFFAGKWHLGPEGFWPEDQGFDVNRGGITRGGPYGGDRYFSPYGNPRLEDGPKGEHLPDRLASETVKFIEQQKDGPFLAYLAFYSVHTPLMSREDLKEKYLAKKEKLKPEVHWGQEHARKVRLVQEHAVYAGMVEAMDQAVGKVLDALERLELTESTVVFFMSDNGGLSTSEGWPTSNLPLRGGKGWLYEGGIREPMLIRWPGVTTPGSVCSVPVISTDFYPTMLEMAGLPPRPEQHVDGLSLVPLLKENEPPAREAIYWHYPHYGNQGAAPGGAVRAGDWKLIEWYEDGRLELFNLKEDIGELKDLASENPMKAIQLRSRLSAWRAATGARMPSTNPKYDPAKREAR